MKTIDLEEIKNQVAVKYGYKDWEWFPFEERGRRVDEVATEYAKQCCDEQIKACAEGIENLEYPKEHVLSTSNVVTTNTK